MNEALLLAVVCLAILLCWAYSSRTHEREFQKERDAWAAERKDLMDRIQAPTFLEYTNKVVREKKAEQPQQEVPVDYDQFVS